MSSLAVIALIILPSFLLPYPVSSALVNRTIDDEYGDSVSGVKPVYAPVDSWHQGSTCSGCHITPFVDATQPFDGTWHDGTYSPNPGAPDLTMSFSFTGTAVYVFSIVPNTIDFTDTLSNITFTLDGAQVGTFLHVPDATTTFLYRQLVYKNTDLANQAHTMEMRSSGTNASLMLFDYVVYSVEQDITSSSTSASSTSSQSSSATSTPSSSHSAPVGAIAGGTVGGIAFLAILAVVGFFFQRRRKPTEPLPPPERLEIKPFADGNDAAAYGGGAVYHGSEYGGSATGGGSAYGGGTGYGSASGSSASGYGATRHAQRPSEAPTMPLLANPDSSARPLPYPSDKGEVVLSPNRLQFPQGAPRSALTRLNTSASQHQAELTQRIRALEDQMRGITSPVRSTRADPSPRAGRPGSHGGEVMRALQNELAALRGEVAGLNAQLAEERMMADSLPPYWEDSSRP